MPENNVSFGTWLNQHVIKSKLLPKCRRCGEILELLDPDGSQSACIQIEEVPENVSVVVPQEVGQWNLFDPGPNGWRQRCDYILMGEKQGDYFAILVELKTSTPSDKGDAQLRWSLPIFHYLLSSYCVDTCSSKWNKNLTVKYFQVGTSVYDAHKDLTRVDGSNFFEKAGQDGIEILYTDSDLLSLDLLLNAAAPQNNTNPQP